MKACTTSPNVALDIDDLPRKFRGQVCASLICAGLELINLLPDEEPYKENPMKKVMATIARMFQPEQCPLADVPSLRGYVCEIKRTRRAIKGAYEYQIARRAETVRSGQPKVWSIR